jgi:hypothetical protein
MTPTSFAEILSGLGLDSPVPHINISLANGHRISLVEWTRAGDCLVERRPDGSPRYLIPLAQIVSVEVTGHQGAAASE